MYVDDFGGVESTQEKAKASFQEMEKLLKELGFEESWEKAEGENEPDECNKNCLSCVTTRSSARDDLPGDYLQHKGGHHEGRNLSVLSKYRCLQKKLELIILKLGQTAEILFLFWLVRH